MFSSKKLNFARKIKPESSCIKDLNDFFSYSAKQSECNSYFGDVVLDSFNMAYRDEDSVRDNKYDKKIFWNLYNKNLKI